MITWQIALTNTFMQARVWLELVHWEQDNGENMRVEQILGTSLNKVLDTKMWHFYLNFCRRRNPLINDTEGRNRALLSQVFEVVLDKVGIDPDAGELWKEYIDFIKDWVAENVDAPTLPRRRPVYGIAYPVDD